MKNINTTITKNNKVLILTEKPFIKDILLKSENFNKYLKTKKDFCFYYTMMTNAYTFDYPKNIKYKDYPKINDLKYKLNNEKIEKNDRRYKEREKTTKDFFSGFEELILCPDPDHTGVYSAVLTLKKTLGKNWKENFNKIIYIKLYNFQKIEKTLSNILFDIDNGKENKENKEWYNKWYEQGKIKRYFEYNYNINSNIFFKEILKKQEIKINFTISKFTIMAFHKFYKMTTNEGITEIEWLSAMEKHEGSKKYINNKEIWCKGIGGPASRLQITQYLKDMKLIEKKEVSKKKIKKEIYDEENNLKEIKYMDIKVYKLFKTEEGKKIIKLLTKKTYDTDLPFRLKIWMQTPYKEAKKGIDKYIIETFKQQKRKNKYL